MGWGALFGQSWTAWLAFRLLILGGMASGNDAGLLGIALGGIFVIGAIGYAVLGAFVGLIIGAMNATDDVGAVIGIIGSFIALGLQYVVGTRSAISLVFGIFLAISIGKYVGAQIATKIQAP